MKFCPVCSNSFPNFLPLPNNYFEILHRLRVPYSLDQFETLNLGQYNCPICQASDRDRLYALFLKAYVQQRQGQPFRILDIAPAPMLSRFLKGLPGAQYRSADLMSPLADDKVDITDMKCYATGSFDFVMCSHVLEHVPDDAKAIRELKRVLAPNGVAILMVPILLGLQKTDEDPSVTDVDERWRRFGQDDHIRMYERSDFLQRLQAGGFQVESLDAAKFGPELFQQCGITEQSVLYIGHH
ncbi:methyltransferase domain-containing protein [Dyella psychrodurans]|uniref:Class I SAM-dependent methyltransferase n=1 Tax=Dyella psychrodurans TaxID=1927960 RepID=A0A370WV63_9GAMM|nr:methyltransferase domain-containing protein [Dyella psychrodurans]RDS79990.1 class I SAM-dependent methyltransferase [Dyella psychrodurans]